MDEELNKGHYLEMIDRLHIIMCNIDEHCYNHPVAEKHPDLREYLNITMNCLRLLYQKVAEKEEEDTVE